MASKIGFMFGGKTQWLPEGAVEVEGSTVTYPLKVWPLYPDCVWDVNQYRTSWETELVLVSVMPNTDDIELLPFDVVILLVPLTFGLSMYREKLLNRPESILGTRSICVPLAIVGI